MVTVIVSKGSKNRLVRTEQCSNAVAWPTTGSGSITADNTTNPFNTGTTADLLDATSAGYLVRQDYATPALDAVETDIYTASIWLKQSTAATTRVSLYQTGVGGGRVDLDIVWATMTITKSTTNSPQYSSVDVRTVASELGFHRFILSMRWVSGFGALRLEIAPGGASGTGRVWAWGAQLELGQAVTSYNAVTLAADPLIGTYRTIPQWIAATNGTLAALEVAQLRDEEYEVPSGLTFNATSTTSFYRKIEPASGVANYNPVTNTGPRIVFRTWPAGGTNGGIVVQENNFVMRGVGILSDSSSRASGSLTQNNLLYINGADAGRYWDCFFNAERGGGDNETFFYGIYLEGAPGAKAVGNNFYDCIIKGNGPFSLRGLSIGILWGSYAEKGGMYGCAIYGCNVGVQSLTKEPVVGKTAAFNAPRIHNTISNTFLGVWKRFSHNISFDGSATSSVNRENPDNDAVLMQFPDPDSRGYMSSSTLWLDADRNDFRPRPGSPLIDEGSDQTEQYTSTRPPDGSAADPLPPLLAGPGDKLDIVGVTRGSTWDIGPYEGAGIPIATAFSTVTKTVGKDRTRDFGSIAAFLKAVPRSLYWANQKWVAQLYDDGGSPDDIAHTIQFDYFDCICGVGTRVEIRAATNYAVKAKAGYRLRCDSGSSKLDRHRPVLWWTVPYSVLSGFMVHQLVGAGPTKNCRVLELYSNLCTVDALYTLFDGATIRYASYSIDVAGNSNLITNNVVRGSNTVGQGSTRGIVITGYSLRNRVFHNNTYRHQGGSTGGGTASKSHGIAIGDNAAYTRVSGCIVAGTGTLNGTGAEDYAFGSGIVGAQTMDRCISQDGTGVGTGTLTSPPTTVWKDPVNGDFRLKLGSPAVNKGTNFSEVFSLDQTGKGRSGPFDIGAYEGVASPPLMATPDPKDHHRRCLAFEIVRADGVVHLYTSASEPIEHAGLTYMPSGQVAASALRREVALKEQSLELTGAIVAADITAEALAAGLYRGAVLTRRVLDWKYPWTTPSRIDVFRIANVGFDSEVWTAELVGPTAVLDQRVGELATVGCSTRLGTEECTVNLPALTEYNIQVGTVLNSRREFTCTISTTRASDYFGLGKLTWITGSAAGLQVDVKTSVGSGTTQTIKLLQKSPFVIQAGDRFDMTPGCRLRYVLDCIPKFNNGPNFQGRPFLVGTDNALDTPTR